MTRKETVLIADDDLSLRAVLTLLLQEEGFNVLQAADGLECLRVAYDKHPDLVLLDIMMPHKDGRQVCRRLREISNVPIIMLTALSGEQNMVPSLTEGADDYVTKPFNNDELVARIRALLRRSRSGAIRDLAAYDDGRLVIDFDGRKIKLRGEHVELSPKEWRLMECLVKHQGRAVPRETLLRYGWGEGYEKEFGSLKVFISHLRQKLSESPQRPRYIHTERDLGYRFDGQM
jgi:two-component system, OmpR family, KDP operon response regulator KdpE